MTLNRAVLVGRMVADPELTYTPSGVASCKFTLAVNRPFSNQQGEKEADFIRIECWRKVAENVANFTKKGSLVGIDGSIRSGSYDGQDGKRVYFTNVNADSVQFLEPRGENNQNTSQPKQQNNSGYQQQYAPQQQTQSQQQYQQPQQNYGQQSNYNNQQQQGYGNQQQQYRRVDEDPFANNKGPIEVSEDDLPFD